MSSTSAESVCQAIGPNPSTRKTTEHQGPITRIASGCTEEELAALEAAYAKLDGGRGKFRLHATPDFSIDEKTGKKYYFYNSALRGFDDLAC